MNSVKIKLVWETKTVREWLRLRKGIKNTFDLRNRNLLLQFKKNVYYIICFISYIWYMKAFIDLLAVICSFHKSKQAK